MSNIGNWPARHVHLDFHTSELIPGVGSRFSKAQFQRALKLGRVNHITLFAKCHHSWSYYPTRAGQKHPTLKIDLLGQQIEACREIGVRCPIYFTVGWSATDAQRHPEWCCHNLDGSLAAISFDPKATPETPKPNYSWKNLCVNTGYRDLVIAQTQEIVDSYHVDGFFYDICFFPRCYCDKCRADMTAAGITIGDSPANVAAATMFYTGVWKRLFEDCRRVIHAKFPNASVFFNGRAHQDTPPELLALQTHYELEDLPTTWGGYDKFMPRAKYFATLDNPPKHVMAMSGKFHTSWGEFGGFKHPDAIKFEAACMIAYGAACSFGDQLHPCGEMDMGTYANVGKAYAYVQKIEQYGLPSRPFSTLAIYVDPGASAEYRGGDLDHEQGVANMLMEAGLDYEIAGATSDLSRYQTIILPGRRCLDSESAKRISAYVARGGCLLVLGESALLAGEEQLAVDIGAKYIGPASFQMDYIVAGKQISKGLEPDCPSPVLSYTAGIRVRPRKGTTKLAAIREPYFDRTYGHYCSHMNTPYQMADAPHAGVIQKGKVIFMAHPWGKLYRDHGARYHRDLLLDVLRRLHTKPTVQAALPSAGRVVVAHQPDKRRYCVHLLYAPPLQRGRCLVIEDMPELRDVKVTLRVPQKIRRVSLPLNRKSLRPTRTAGALSAMVPRVTCHQVVMFEY